eukprot:CFRG6184T1
MQALRSVVIRRANTHSFLASLHTTSTYNTKIAPIALVHQCCSGSKMFLTHKCRCGSRMFSTQKTTDETATDSSWKNKDVHVPEGRARLGDEMIEDIMLTFDENDDGDISDDDETIPKGRDQKLAEESSKGNANVNPLSYVNPVTGEIGGPRGPEPVRYGDWEVKGRCSDF